MSDNVKNVVQSVLFGFILLSVFLFNIICKDNEISLSEKRKLQLMPDVSFESIFDGSFFDNFDKYSEDQFFIREPLRNVSMFLDLNVRGEYNNLAVKNNYIYEKRINTNIKSVDNFISKINLIDEMYLSDKNNVYYSIIPDKSYFIDNDYSYIINRLNNEFSYKYINIMDCLSLSDYYKTDQHWKQENIKLVAKRVLESMNKEYFDDYKETFVKEFSGTYGNRLSILNVKDKLKILTSNTLENSLVFNYEKNNVSSIYNLSNMSIDSYDIYLDGPVSIISIVNNDINIDDELIIFRDSFSSSLAPLLLNQYKKITLVDTRYISPRLISNYVKFDKQDVLFIYSTLIINNSYTFK